MKASEIRKINEALKDVLNSLVNKPINVSKTLLEIKKLIKEIYNREVIYLPDLINFLSNNNRIEDFITKFVYNSKEQSLTEMENLTYRKELCSILNSNNFPFEYKNTDKRYTKKAIAIYTNAVLIDLNDDNTSFIYWHKGSSYSFDEYTLENSRNFERLSQEITGFQKNGTLPGDSELVLGESSGNGFIHLFLGGHFDNLHQIPYIEINFDMN